MKIKRILGIFLTVCLIFSILPTNVFAASPVNIFNITVTEPKVGEKPSYSGSVPATASTTVTNVEWVGNLASDGTFASGEKYTVKVTCTLKPGQDKYIKYVASTAKINTKLASLVSVATDKKSIVLKYTFNLGSNTVNEEPTGNTGSIESSGNASISNSNEILTASYKDLSVNNYEWEVLRIVNVERAKEGLDSLSMPQALQYSCNVREKEIVTLFSHTRPDGTTCYTAIGNYFKSNAQGENIAKGQKNPSVVMNSWMNSPGHHANIMNDLYGYLGVGYEASANAWVQLFASRKNISKVEVNTDKREFTETEILDCYLTITTSDGYLSYMPIDFDSMKKVGDEYYPRLNAKNLPAFKKTEKAQSVQPAPEQTTPEQTPPKTEPEKEQAVIPPAESTPSASTEEFGPDSLFGRYIPIEQVYPSNFFVAYNLTPKSYRFQVGTQFLETTTSEKPSFAPVLKRCNYQGHYVKINYLGTYGSISKDVAVTTLGIITEEEYNKVMNGQESEWATAYNLTKDTIVISADIYDANKKFIRALSNACVIVATSEDGSFITFSNYLGSSSTILFSQIDNLFTPDADVKRSSKALTFVANKIMLSDKSYAEKLLTAVEETVYEFKSYPELTNAPNYNANHILTYNEFVTPENVYYQVGTVTGKIDPVVKTEIKDVVNYSYYTHGLGVDYRQRNIVTSDGTLYGVSTRYEKKTIASNVKKATANHYLTNDGVVKELNGKIIATDAADIEESNDGLIIGIIKKDGTFHMGYTYIAGADSYAKGITKFLDNVKCVVPNGVIDNDNTLYRWDNQTTMTGIDMNAFYSGQVVSNYETKLSVKKVCNNVERIFPYEYLSKIFAHDEANINDSIYGFVQTNNGKLYGFSSTYHQSFATYSGKVERIFPVFTSDETGNFVGVKVDNEPTPFAITARYCDGNTYRWGQLVLYKANCAKCPPYVCETLGGYYGNDGVVYGVEEHPQDSGLQNEIIVSLANGAKNLPQMHRQSATYRAYNRDEDSNIPLLPNVLTWNFDSKRIILLERTDGSVWMADVLNSSTAADLIAKTGGYESSNVFQVSSPTTKKVSIEYFDIKNVTPPTSTKLQFTDVAPDAWYASPVQWAVDRGITAGTSAVTFSPDNTCTRAQILTFLWRAVGSPKMSGANPFSDVSQTDYYYDAALWANSKGMVSGTMFEGNTPCTRSATVIYLWKNAGSPSAVYSGNFADVNVTSSYAQAVAWAVNSGVTSGTSVNTFSPDTTCTRGQIVTFLQRAIK